MPVESDADRLTFLEDWDIATIGATPVKGVFNNAYISVDGGEVNMSGTRPEFFCRSSDVTSVVTGTTIVINSITYTVVDIQPDGTGFTNLILRK